MDSRGTSDVSTGNDIMMVGLVTQVITLFIFGLMSADVFLRIRSHRGEEFTPSALEMRSSIKFKGLLIALAVSYTTIFIRCIYRIAEMAGGWSNPIMQSQIPFIIFDGVMCVVAVLALNVWHPGFLFAQSYATVKAERMGATEVEMDGA